MDLTHILDRLDQIEKGLAELLSKHRRAIDSEDYEEVGRLQANISDLISMVDNLKSEIRRGE
jgi:uncharacterized protein Yka (UPF0111/DUF47 family)